MQYKGIHKTVLAMMVGAAVAPANAADTDVGSGQNTWVNQTLNQSLTLVGTRSVTATQNLTYGVSISDTTINGSLINRATVSMDGTARSVGGMAIDGAFTSGGMPAGGTITGDVIQAGTVRMTGLPSAEGFEIGATTIGGSVINSGKIIIDASGVPFGEGEGLYLNGTRIDGDVSNTGLIDVTAYDGTGVIIDRHNALVVEIGGKLLNAGTIRVTGEEAVALDFEAPTSDLRVENSGLISAKGDQAFGIKIYEGNFDYLLNTGTLEANGSNATAFSLRGATFTTHLASGARGIINRGTINAGGTAIQVDAVDQTSPFEINQQAGEIRSASGVAIDGAHLVTLNWSGGTIVGDVRNVSAVNITGSADFFGSRLDGPVSISAGSLNLSAPGTTVNGDLTVGSGAGIDMRLGSGVVPTSPYLSVSGVASFAPAARLTVSAKPGDFNAVSSGTEYTLLHAASVVDNNLVVASHSALLDVLSFSTDAQTVKALVAVKSNPQVDDELTRAGASRAAISAVNELKSNVLGRLGQDDPVFQASANASAQQLAQLGEQLKPEVSRGALDVALSGQASINGVISNRLTAQRFGREATGVWVQGLSNNLDQGQRQGVDGYSAHTSGVAVGVDGRLNDTTTLGVAYSYLNANVRSDQGNKTQIQGNALSLYGNWVQDYAFVEAALGYGHNDNDSRRHIAGTTAKGSYGSDVYCASVLGGYRLNVSQALLLEPRVAARYSNVGMDGFSEKGSSAALRTGAQRYEVGELGAGLRVAVDFPLSAGRLQPDATLMAYHDLMGDRVAQTSAFVLGGSTFTVTGASVARDSVEASLGLTYQLSAFSVGASYTRQARSGFDADGLMLKARYAF